jgi:hypothetical protein
MNQRDREEMLHDGSSDARRVNFAIAAVESLAWERANPRSLDEYVEFLQAVQELFGPFPVDHEPWTGDEFRL